MNHKNTKAFLAKIDRDTRDGILRSIAAHYGCSTAMAYDAITDDEEAEHLLDYLTGSVRAATSVLMRRHGFSIQVAGEDC
jgi:hypothetical protein